MNFQSIENYITQFPIYQYTFLSIDDIEFNDKVRTICKRECPRYGKSWSCPPAVGTVDKCRERCQQYTHALFFCGRSTGLFQYGCSACYQTGA